MKNRIVIAWLILLLVGGGGASYVYAAEAELGSASPEHIVLTWADDPSISQQVTWRTDPHTTETVVQLMKEGGSFEEATQIKGTSFLFESDEGTMRIHEAGLKDLEPGTTYTYRVGDGNTWSPSASFTTESMQQETFSFLFTSDSQSAPSTNTTWGYGIWGEVFAKAKKDYPNARFMLLSGDIVDYGDQQIHWENWFKASAPYLPSINLVPTLGNHDVAGAGEKNFAAQFQLPENGPEGEKEFAYSFDYSNIHMAVLNSEGDLQKQAEWLREDMEASDKQWKIVSFHRSPYHSHPDRSSPNVRKAWTPIFDEVGADLVLSGHDHAYMRSWPLKNGEKVAEGEGTTYVIGGSTGPKFYDMEDQPWMRVTYDEDEQIYSGITVNRNELTFKVTNRSGETVDSFTMMKPKDALQTIQDQEDLKEWKETSMVEDRNKIWTVSFSQNIDPSSITDQSIRVFSEDGQLKDVAVEMDGRDVTIKPNTPYKPGVYHLIVSSTVSNMEGKPMSEGIEKVFTIQR